MLALLVGLPVLLIAVSIPLMLGMVPRNHWYGFRTPKTLSSDSVWYPANRIGDNTSSSPRLCNWPSSRSSICCFPANLCP